MWKEIILILEKCNRKHVRTRIESITHRKWEHPVKSNKNNQIMSINKTLEWIFQDDEINLKENQNHAYNFSFIHFDWIEQTVFVDHETHTHTYKIQCKRFKEKLFKRGKTIDSVSAKSSLSETPGIFVGLSSSLCECKSNAI